MAEPSDLTPEEWLTRLGRKIVFRRTHIERWRRYYDGDQDLPQGPSQHREAFQQFQRTARTNLCLLCVESMVHRTQINGFRASSGSGDESSVWKLWQAAKLDARQFGIWRKAYSRGSAYLTVGVDPRKPRTPRVSIEGPENVIVETDPADRSRRLAALRLWYDEIATRWFATLYLPGPDPESAGLRYRWQSQKTGLAHHPGGPVFGSQSWQLREDPSRSLSNVPVVPFLNGDEGEIPRAEFAAGMDIQDRLNLTVLNRLTAERYAAFRQRGILNFEPEEDPVTGVTISPFKPGSDQVWTLPPPEPGDPEPKMFDFAQTDTSSILRAVESDMRSFAATTITPVYYLPGDLVNIGSDTVAALDAGHVNKVRQSQTVFGEGAEETLQLMADVAELDIDLTESEVVWMRPETFNPSAVADFLVKLASAGVPLPMAAEEVGWSPQRVAALRSEMAADAFRQALLQPQAAQQKPPLTQDTGLPGRPREVTPNDSTAVSG